MVNLPFSNSSEVLRFKFLGSDRLFSFSSICKFGSFKKPFATITSLSELYFRFRRLFCWYKQKTAFYELWHQCKQLKTMEMSEVRPDIYNEGWYGNSNLNSSQNSLTAAEALSLKISSHGTSLKWSRTIPITTRIIISYAMKQGIPFRVC